MSKRKPIGIIEEVEIDENGKIITPVEKVLSLFHKVGDKILQITISHKNVNINNSYLIETTREKKEVINYILETASDHGITFKRSIKSWLREWKAHNVLFKLGIKKQQTRSVDLNEDENLFRRIGYFLISWLEF